MFCNFANVHFFLLVLEWSKLRIITGDFRWFIWRGKFFLLWLGNYCIRGLLLLFCPLFNKLSTSLYLFSVVWRSESTTVLASFGNRKWFDFVLAFWRKLSRSSDLNKSSLLVSFAFIGRENRLSYQKRPDQKVHSRVNLRLLKHFRGILELIAMEMYSLLF